MFQILGGQNFKLDSYKDVVRPATNIVSGIEFSFSRNLHFGNKKKLMGLFFIVTIVSITNRKRKMLEININAQFAPGELMEELEEILDSFPSKLFHPKW